MNAKQFFDLVATMRSAQREWYSTHNYNVMSRAKQLEGQVDAEIARARQVLEGRRPEQTELNFE